MGSDRGKERFMFNVNDRIHYGGSGVCVVQEIAVMRFGRTRERYYVLRPLHQNASLIYVPVDNPQLVSKMRPVLTREEVDALIDAMPAVETVWIEDPQERKNSFDAMLRSNDCRDLIVIIKTLSEQKKRRQSQGKALHVSDDTCLREAQRLLFDEFAGVLGLKPAQVSEYIRQKLGLPA